MTKELEKVLKSLTPRQRRGYDLVSNDEKILFLQGILEDRQLGVCSQYQIYQIK